MVTTNNTGARLDRLPISSFHYRIFWLIAAGMFFDGYDLYVAGPVLGAAVQSKFSTLTQNGWFLSLTFVGMTLGSLLAGFLGDRFGRRFTYQFNLMIFGLASLAAAIAPDIYICLERSPLRDGCRPRRRDRCRLWNHDRVCAATKTRQMDGLHGLCCRVGSARHSYPSLTSPIRALLDT
jgi:hypothetical protein